MTGFKKASHPGQNVIGREILQQLHVSAVLDGSQLVLFCLCVLLFASLKDDVQGIHAAHSAQAFVNLLVKV